MSDVRAGGVVSVDLVGGFRLVGVQRFKRGAYWGPGDPRMCLRCGISRGRRRQAVLTALLTRPPARYRLPVAYCRDHMPDEVAT